MSDSKGGPYARMGSVVKGPYKTHVNEIYFRKEFVHEPIENQRNKTSGLGLINI